MKQVLQYRRSGQTRVVDVPAPVVPEGGVLVRTRWSLISPGTERMLVEAGGANLVSTALRRPDLVRQVLDKAQRDGIGATVNAVRSRIDTAVPLGYSCAGVVEAVGSSGGPYSPGDQVACAGAGDANHAEFVSVPRNLTVRVPPGVSLEDAAFCTLGAVALQGVRIADVRVGDCCVVIGLGLVGQLTVQLLKAAGCRVFGIDVAADKVTLAARTSADEASVRSDPLLADRVLQFSSGRGADAVLITAGTATSDPVELAARLARDRGIVVAVGLVGMNVPRNAYYEKELQLRLSRSYGPGRYDRSYERDGVDYPIGYVRWTEQRNMESFLQLVAEGKVRPSALVTHRIPIHQAEKAYAIVTGATPEPYLGILLEYAGASALTTRVDRPVLGPSAPLGHQPIRLAVIGAGSFGRAVLLPAIKRLGPAVELRGIAASSGPSAQQTAERFAAGYATTDWRQVIADRQVDAVVVATRHDLHVAIAAEALRAGKAVMLEKPMALNEDGLSELVAAWQASGRQLMLGFNRRFSPAVQRVAAFFSARRYPLVLNYRVNAGPVASGSWVVDQLQGGGRVIGEVCHMVDTLSFLAGARVTRVFAQPLTSTSELMDDVVLSLAFADGSVGSISYVSAGDRSVAKERIEVSGGQRTALVEDFVRLTLFEGGRETLAWKGAQDKGHSAELAAFLGAVGRGGPSPIDPEHSAHVTRVTFAAVQSARAALPVDLGED